jgi:hypothetical protein
MRTRAQSFGARHSVTKVMVAMVLIAMPTAGVSVSAYASPASTPNPPARYGVLPAPPPADPPTNTPQPPPPPPPPPAPAPPAGGYNGGDYYCGSCGSQAGGGGGG